MLADQIGRHVNDQLIEPARKAKKSQVIVRAGDVHKDLGLKNRMPAVCGALNAWIFQDQYNVILSKRTGPYQGANTTWYFGILP